MSESRYMLYRKEQGNVVPLGVVQSCTECIQEDKQNVYFGVYKRSLKKIFACNNKDCVNFNKTNLFVKDGI